MTTHSSPQTLPAPPSNLQWSVYESLGCGGVQEVCGDGHCLQDALALRHQPRDVGDLLYEAGERGGELDVRVAAETTHLLGYGDKLKGRGSALKVNFAITIQRREGGRGRGRERGDRREERRERKREREREREGERVYNG